MKAFKIKLVLFIFISVILVARKSVCKELYTVRPGDLIEDVSAAYDVSSLKILSANPSDKFIPVCVREKEFTAENGKKFKLCQKVTYWLKAGTQIKIPVSISKTENVAEKEKKYLEEIKRQSEKLLAELQVSQENYKKLAQALAQAKEQEPQNGFTKLFPLIFVILGFCVLMSLAIVAVVFYLRKINRKISTNGRAHQTAELAALQAEVAIEKHNLWERQKEMAAIMADLRQEKLGLRRERERLEEERRQLEEDKKAIDAKKLDLENIERGLRNWAKKKKGELEAKEKELSEVGRSLEENLEVLDLSNLEDETTLDQNAVEPEQVEELKEQEQKKEWSGQKGWENNPTRRVEAPESKSRKRGRSKNNRETPI